MIFDDNDVILSKKSSRPNLNKSFKILGNLKSESVTKSILSNNSHLNEND